MTLLGAVRNYIETRNWNKTLTLSNATPKDFLTFPSFAIPPDTVEFSAERHLDQRISENGGIEHVIIWKLRG
jgi:hypothetical protein